MKLSRLTIGLVIGWLVVVTLIVKAVFVAISPNIDANRETAVSGIAVAAATLILALLTAKSMEESRQQAQSNQRSLYRPLLIPASSPPRDYFPDHHAFDIDFRNVGHGVAHNIWGVLMPTTLESASTPSQYSVRPSLPLAAGDSTSLCFSQGGTAFLHQDNIQGVPFGVPKELAPEEGIPDHTDRRDRVIARLTLTYADIFSCYHMSVYDYTAQAQWVSVANLDAVPVDLGELDRRKGIAR